MRKANTAGREQEGMPPRMAVTLSHQAHRQPLTIIPTLETSITSHLYEPERLQNTKES